MTKRWNFSNKIIFQFRSSHWSVDLKRRESNWQRCLITSCSKVRQRLFATIQILNDSTFIVLRNVDEMKITRVIDNLVDAKQVCLYNN